MLIRNARLVPLTEPAPQALVDVLVEDGVVTRVGPGLGDETAGRATTWSTPTAAG